MNDLPDRPTTRRLQTWALLAAPAAGLLTTLVWPHTPIDTGERLAVLADAAGRTQAAHLLNLVTILLFVPAAAGLYRLAQQQRPRAAAAGVGLVGAGLLGWSGILAFSAAELQVARRLPTETAVAAAEALPGTPVAAVMLVAFLLGTFIGLVVLATALWRSDLVPGWVPLAIGVAAVTDVVASTVTAAVVAVWVLLGVSFAAVARVRAQGDTATASARAGRATASV